MCASDTNAQGQRQDQNSLALGIRPHAMKPSGPVRDRHPSPLSIFSNGRPFFSLYLSLSFSHSLPVPSSPSRLASYPSLLPRGKEEATIIPCLSRVQKEPVSISPHSIKSLSILGSSPQFHFNSIILDYSPPDHTFGGARGDLIACVFVRACA